VRVTRLELTNYRNYAALGLSLPPGLTVLHGPNAQGKTNVLEALYLLATGSPHRAVSDREVIRWDAPESERLARVTASVEAGDGGGAFELELVIANLPGQATKRTLVNGAGKRMGDFAGRLTAVLFGPEQLDLVTGSPGQRRAYLDETLSQTDRAYLHATAVYSRVLQQRNQLLKQFHEREVHPDELLYWDAQLVEAGSLIIARRARCLLEVGPLAARHHAELAPSEAALGLEYETKLFREGGGWRAAGSASLEEVQAEFGRWLTREAERELAQGTSVVGPHRDDLVLTLAGKLVDKFGSRGQQRTVALALKLAELDVIRGNTGDQPVLLLDDVLSELDPARRAALRDVIRQQEQVFLTATDPPELEAAAAYAVREGTLTPSS
jgi:DNA replication and repair protein RecF